MTAPARNTLSEKLIRLVMWSDVGDVELPHAS